MSKVILTVVLLVSGLCQGFPEEVEGLDSLEHLQTSEATEDKIQGIPDDLKGKVKPMKFKPPQLSDEEERSPHMPAYMACDACIAVTIQLEKGLKQAHRHLSMTKDLKQWDVIETFENICQYKTFEEYGVTDHEGKHRLKGPGLDPTVGAGGVSHMGGKWPSRLAEICLEITGEFEDQEMEIYRTWKTEENNLLGDFLCRNSNRTGLDRCLNIVEQGELVRDDIEDMLKTMGNPENRNSEPSDMKIRRAAMDEPEGLPFSDELTGEIE